MHVEFSTTDEGPFGDGPSCTRHVPTTLIRPHPSIFSWIVHGRIAVHLLYRRQLVGSALAHAYVHVNTNLVKERRETVSGSAFLDLPLGQGK